MEQIRSFDSASLNFDPHSSWRIDGHWIAERDKRETFSQFRIPLQHVQKFLAGRAHNDLVMPQYAVAYIYAYTTTGAASAVDLARQRLYDGREYVESDIKRGFRFLGSLVRKGFLHEDKQSSVRRFLITDLGEALLACRFPD